MIARARTLIGVEVTVITVQPAIHQGWLEEITDTGGLMLSEPVSNPATARVLIAAETVALIEPAEGTPARLLQPGDRLRGAGLSGVVLDTTPDPLSGWIPITVETLTGVIQVRVPPDTRVPARRPTPNNQEGHHVHRTQH